MDEVEVVQEGQIFALPFKAITAAYLAESCGHMDRFGLCRINELSRIEKDEYL